MTHFIYWSKKCPFYLLVEKVSILFIGRKSVPFYLLVEKVSTLLLVDNMSVDNMSVENMSVEKTSRCRECYLKVV